MPLAPSELILNEDGSIYHLNLQPHQVARTIITVGDPGRVHQVSKHFDFIEHRVSRREFHTHTGSLSGTPITCISTGIGTDNIDIVLNELDALVNVDFKTRELKDTHTALNIIRIGTSGAIQPSVPVDSFLLSRKAIGLDSLLHWYENDVDDSAFAKALHKHLNLPKQLSKPYIIDCDESLAARFQSISMINGVTVTNVGFYAPQNRSIRLKPAVAALQQRLIDFNFENHNITNLEMETSGIYALAKLLGHKAVSLNAILANRATGSFSTMPQETVDKLIKFTLEVIAS